ncbi:MAG: hypothetical protein CMI53_03645 [Parcubacteria group bacterium]|nr:hypothetical protein [Parcubacteria group bacterium]|tara:strand:- start:3415 stop:3777 length:363 start_codon:yes stop_codon:yes gene_type:complete
MDNHPTTIQLFFNDKVIKGNLLFSILVNIFLWIFLVWQVKSFPDLISLHYNIYFGIDLLGSKYQLFLLPVLGLIFFFINLLIGSMVYTKEKILSYFLSGASTLSQFIFLIAVAFITIINQ